MKLHVQGFAGVVKPISQHQTHKSLSSPCLPIISGWHKLQGHHSSSTGWLSLPSCSSCCQGTLLCASAGVQDVHTPTLASNCQHGWRTCTATMPTEPASSMTAGHAECSILLHHLAIRMWHGLLSNSSKKQTAALNMPLAGGLAGQW